MEMATFNKRGQVNEARRHQADAEQNDFYRRTALNKKLGMTARNPYAFQLSNEQLAEAEEAVANGDPPIPIATADNGLRMLVDPWREDLRRRAREAQPDMTHAERRAKYVCREGIKA